MSINPNWDYSHVRGYRTDAPTPERRSSGTGSLRTLLNSVAHKRAREVARKKRIAKDAIKVGVALAPEFRTNRQRQ
jgi:hypothetical protein